MVSNIVPRQLITIEQAVAENIPYWSDKDPEQELQLCAASKLYFATNYFWARTEENTFVPLGKLWASQVATIKAIDEYGWVYSLKARKLGISTIGCAIDLHNFVFKPHSRVHLFSKIDDDAIDLLNRIKQAYDKLPGWMRAAKDMQRNTHTLMADFDNHGDERVVQAYATNPDSGRSQSCNHLHADEFAIVDANKQEDLWAAMEPSIVPGGTMHMMSTGRGNANFAAQMWRDCVEGRRKIYPLFLNYKTRPGRDGDWYEQKKLSTPERKLKQEYPRNWSEALVDPERAVFPDEMREKCYVTKPYISTGEIGRTYICAWDLGFENDAAVFIALDVTSLPFWVANVEIFYHTPYTALQIKAKELFAKFPGYHYVEDNAMGKNFIQNLTFTALPHNTNVKSKPEGIARLQLLMEQSQITYNVQQFPGSLIDEQLSGYMWEDLKLTQDIVMALSIVANYAYERMNYGYLNEEQVVYASPEKERAFQGSIAVEARSNARSIINDYEREKRSFEW